MDDRRHPRACRCRSGGTLAVRFLPLRDGNGSPCLASPGPAAVGQRRRRRVPAACAARPAWLVPLTPRAAASWARPAYQAPLGQIRGPGATPIRTAAMHCRAPLPRCRLQRSTTIGKSQGLLKRRPGTGSGVDEACPAPAPRLRRAEAAIAGPPRIMPQFLPQVKSMSQTHHCLPIMHSAHCTMPALFPRAGSRLPAAGRGRPGMVGSPRCRRTTNALPAAGVTRRIVPVQTRAGNP